MKTALHAKLQQAIQETLDEAAENENLWIDDAYVHPELAEHMTNAAASVWDATVASSKFTENQRPA